MFVLAVVDNAASSDLEVVAVPVFVVCRSESVVDDDEEEEASFTAARNGINDVILIVVLYESIWVNWFVCVWV